ncbi:MAG: hypothetical protein EXS55_00170 [Candidatus Magasanikbacteria bacterium]|nr:hypothetical protein [Candidatus Magasanikbacteria bacterium]
MADAIHKNIAAGSWFTMTLCEQLGNVGSEIGRATKWERQGDVSRRNQALDRAFDLLDLTMADTRWRKRLKEICRAREVVADTFYGKREYNDTPEGLEKYFFKFALAARKDK